MDFDGAKLRSPFTDRVSLPGCARLICQSSKARSPGMTGLAVDKTDLVSSDAKRYAGVSK